MSITFEEYKKPTSCRLLFLVRLLWCWLRGTKSQHIVSGHSREELARIVIGSFGKQRPVATVTLEKKDADDGHLPTIPKPTSSCCVGLFALGSPVCLASPGCSASETNPSNKASEITEEKGAWFSTTNSRETRLVPIVIFTAPMLTPPERTKSSTRTRDTSAN